MMKKILRKKLGYTNFNFFNLGLTFPILIRELCSYLAPPFLKMEKKLKYFF